MGASWEHHGSIMGASCEKPNWEQTHSNRMREYEIIENFKKSLIAFIKVVGIFPERNNNQIAELLGTVEIDLIQRFEEIEKILKKL